MRTAFDAKSFEIRDRMTLIPCMAIKMQGGMSRRLLQKAGYDEDTTCVLFMRADGDGYARCDPYEWNDRTMQTAHVYLERFWYVLQDTMVIDVEYVLGESIEPKTSECGGIAHYPGRLIERKG